MKNEIDELFEKFVEDVLTHTKPTIDDNVIFGKKVNQLKSEIKQKIKKLEKEIKRLRK